MGFKSIVSPGKKADLIKLSPILSARKNLALATMTTDGLFLEIDKPPGYPSVSNIQPSENVSSILSKKYFELTLSKFQYTNRTKNPSSFIIYGAIGKLRGWRRVFVIPGPDRHLLKILVEALEVPSFGKATTRINQDLKFLEVISQDRTFPICCEDLVGLFLRDIVDIETAKRVKIVCDSVAKSGNIGYIDYELFNITFRSKIFPIADKEFIFKTSALSS